MKAVASQWMLSCLQGFSQAKLAWKKKNAIPQTSKEVKAARPDGRGDMGGRGGRGQTPNRGGGRAPAGEAATAQLSAKTSLHRLHQQQRTVEQTFQLY